jgi:hypothetical protein
VISDGWTAKKRHPQDSAHGAACTDDLPNPYDGNRQILFEAFSSDGNSGSPVFVTQQGLDSKPGFKYYGVYHPLFLAGINAGLIEVKEPIETKDGAIIQNRVGLSRMYKARGTRADIERRDPDAAMCDADS